MAEDQLQSQLPQRQSAFARSSTSIPRTPDGKFPKKGTPEYDAAFTPEYREQRRQEVQRLIAEGKFGGKNGFHRRKTKKAHEILAERAQAHADELWEVLIGNVRQKKDRHLQLKAIEQILGTENWSVKNSREEEKDLRGMTNAQLDERLLDILGEGLGLDLTALREAMNTEQVTDAEVVEDDQAPYDPMVETLGRLGGDRLAELAEEADDVDDAA